MCGRISNDRILETHIVPGTNGSATADSGFRRGIIRYGTNPIFDPPLNFAQAPRPVVTPVVPVHLNRDGDQARGAAEKERGRDRRDAHSYVEWDTGIGAGLAASRAHPWV